ncbi:lipoprotein-attachment site-containing protein [Cohaesibacter sp. ES.047]|uniref:LPS translocon maturation chaperone LptM n=1 Tax=Cohaesibacter sp. ES.047 TaxID=1798205 RepID=UPI000BBF7CDA|nr:lipoprotein [Cohaesibacter sp. ES.047]SNY90811.1 lipoprotein-attachment site-containing protein [Cohaesibacter sp. ES.047]
MPILSARPTIARTGTLNGTKALAILLLAAGLAACGQRGPLEPPTANTNVQTDIADPENNDLLIIGADKDTSTPTKAPDDGFILDPLL